MVFPDPVSPVSAVTGDEEVSIARTMALRARCAGSSSRVTAVWVTAASNRAFSAATASGPDGPGGSGGFCLLSRAKDADGGLGARFSAAPSVVISFAPSRRAARAGSTAYGTSPATMSFVPFSAFFSSSAAFSFARVFVRRVVSFSLSNSTKTTAPGASDRESERVGPGGACNRAVLGAFFIALNLPRAALNSDSRSSARAICNSLVSPDAHVAVTAIFSPAGFGRSKRCGCRFGSSSFSRPTPPGALPRRSARLSSFSALWSTFSFFSRSRSSLRASLARARSRCASWSSSSPERTFRCLSFAAPSPGALALPSDALSSSDRR